MVFLQYKKGDVKEQVQEVCKNIYYWRCFIVSSAFHQSCGFITVQVSNVEYIPGLSFTVQNKSFRYPQKCVWVSVCTLRWHFTINIHTYSIKSHRITIKRREAVSHFSHQRSIVLKKPKQRKVKKYQPLRPWLHTEWKRAGIIPGMWGCCSHIFGWQTSNEWRRDLFFNYIKLDQKPLDLPCFCRAA